MLGREGFLALAATDLRREEVELPELGDSVFVRVMSGTERDAFEAQHVKDPRKDVRARLAVATLCDAAGARLFDPSAAADVEAVGRASSVVLDRVFAAAMRLNKIGKDDIDELEKN